MQWRDSAQHIVAYDAGLPWMHRGHRSRDGVLLWDLTYFFEEVRSAPQAAGSYEADALSEKSKLGKFLKRWVPIVSRSPLVQVEPPCDIILSPRTPDGMTLRGYIPFHMFSTTAMIHLFVSLQHTTQTKAVVRSLLSAWLRDACSKAIAVLQTCSMHQYLRGNGFDLAISPLGVVGGWPELLASSFSSKVQLEWRLFLTNTTHAAPILHRVFEFLITSSTHIHTLLPKKICHAGPRDQVAALLHRGYF